MKPPDAAAVAEELDVHAVEVAPTTRPSAPANKRLLRSKSERKELIEGLAVAGPEGEERTSKDKPGRVACGKGANKGVSSQLKAPASQSGADSSGSSTAADVNEMPDRKTLPLPLPAERLGLTVVDAQADAPSVESLEA